MNFLETTAIQALEKWDAGQPIWTIELGGMGPGYEQCIQVAAMEVLRDAIKDAIDPEDEKVFYTRAEKTISYHDEALGGMSGAQAGSAMGLAYRAYRMGWSEMLLDAQKQEGFKQDRFILISKHWPRAKELCKKCGGSLSMGSELNTCYGCFTEMQK